MSSFSDRTKHEVVRGSRQSGLEGKTFPAGHALHFEGTEYFVLKLWFQQERTYFISKNHGSDEVYTVFGKKAQQEGETQVRFQNPIGFARVNEQKTHLEIVLPDLPRRYYMSLFPSP